MSIPLRLQKKLIGGVPLTVTLNVAGFPSTTIWLGVCATMVGGMAGTITVRLATELVAAP